MLDRSVAAVLAHNIRWFRRPGAYVLVDGQFGSTGKGLMAAALAQVGGNFITHVTTNAGPNSGHTAHLPGGGTIMTQQVPVASVALYRAHFPTTTYLNAGAIINPVILERECETYLGGSPVIVHPNAAVITAESVLLEQDSSSIQKIASTGKGVGAALAAKVMRNGNVAVNHHLPLGVRTEVVQWDWDKHVVFVETAQGFSLGINEARFYPYTTSRECTVMQALADARIPQARVRGVCATYPTFPIRVGNTEGGQSGGHYPDQEETTWEALGLQPEHTSVTKRVRRVFTWSRLQFMESVAANEPDVLFLNFMNYLSEEKREDFVLRVLADYRAVMCLNPALVLLGLGPKASDIRVW